MLSPKPQTCPHIAHTMEEKPVNEQSSPISVNNPLPKPSIIDLKTGMKHILGPAVIGMTLGILAEIFLTPNYSWPSPPQAVIIGSILLSPVLYFVLVGNEKSRWWEYSLGLLTPGLFFIMIWFSGWGALFCGVYLPLLIWVWISTSWGQYDLPPFRYGVWHLFGLNIGGFAGAILAFFQYL